MSDTRDSSTDKQQLKDSLAAMSYGTVPDFEQTFAAAGNRYRNEKRRRAVGSIAAAFAVLGIVSMLWMSGRTADDYVSAETLMATTYWTAPSDVLLPRPEIDIYQDLPILIESTNFNEGALL